VIADGLACDAAAAGFCELALQAQQGERLILCLIGDTISTEVPVALRADGRMHTYHLRCRAGEWEGAIRAIALYGHGGEPVRCSIDRLRLTDTWTAPPDVRIRALAPDRRLALPGAPVTVTCRLQNIGASLNERRPVVLTPCPGLQIQPQHAQTIGPLGRHAVQMLASDPFLDGAAVAAIADVEDFFRPAGAR